MNPSGASGQAPRIEPLNPWTDHGELTPLGFSGSCPDCRCIYWYAGPAKGFARLIECAGCKSRFQVCVFQGKLLMAERKPRGERDSQWVLGAVKMDSSHITWDGGWAGVTTPTLTLPY